MPECPWAGHIVVHGEGRKFVSALITLDPEMITEWASEHGLAGRVAGAAGQGTGGPRADPASTSTR